MKTRSLLFAVAILLSLLNATVAFSQQGHTIRGKVRNSRGMNLSQVKVDLQTGTGSLVSQTVTNNEGDFLFNELSGNSYLVVITSPDYNPFSEHVEFVGKSGPNEPGETRTIDITLSPKTVAGAPPPGTSFVQDVPPQARAALVRALRLSKEGKSQLALALLQESLRIFPQYFDARFALGNELLKANRLNDAIAELEQARRINPRDARVYETFGLVLLRQRKYAVAAAVFAEAARLNPLASQPQLLRAIALIEYATQLGSESQSAERTAERNAALTEAETHLTTALQLSGQKLPAVHLQRARIYEKRGEPARAAAELEQYLQESPEPGNADAIRQAIKKLRDAPAGQKSSTRP